jgi:hypothetical protein
MFGAKALFFGTGATLFKSTCYFIKPELSIAASRYEGGTK